MPAAIDIKSFRELTVEELYCILALRSAVFVVEQKSIYQDADALDSQAIHVLATDGSKLVGYARILPPGVKYRERSFGRLAVIPGSRKTGLGKQLMETVLNHLFTTHGHDPIRIEAQAYLKKFYETYDFRQVGSPYDLDGIEHIEMLCSF